MFLIFEGDIRIFEIYVFVCLREGFLFNEIFIRMVTLTITFIFSSVITCVLNACIFYLTKNYLKKRYMLYL